MIITAWDDDGDQTAKMELTTKQLACFLRELINSGVVEAHSVGEKKTVVDDEYMILSLTQSLGTDRN